MAMVQGVNLKSDQFFACLEGIGTDEQGLEVLFRSISNSKEAQQFISAVEHSEKAEGKKLDELLIEEVSGRTLGRLQTILQTALRGSDYYVGRAYGPLADLVEDLKSNPQNSLNRLNNRFAEKATELGLSSEEIQQITNPAVELVLLASRLVKEKRNEFETIAEQYAIGTGSFDQATTKEFVSAYHRVNLLVSILITKIKTGKEITPKELERLNSAMADVQREFDIFIGQEHAGRDQRISNMETAENTSYMVVGGSVAILTGGMILAEVAGAAVLTATGGVTGGISQAGLGGAVLATVGGGTAGAVAESKTKVIVGTFLKNDEGVEIEHWKIPDRGSVVDAGGAALSLGVGQGLGLAGKALAATATTTESAWVATTAGLGARVLANPVGRGVIMNEMVSVGNAGLAYGVYGETDFGWEDMAVAGISGYIGGRFEPLWASGIGMAHANELGFEMTREFLENVATEQLKRGYVTQETVIQSAGGALNELAGSSGKMFGVNGHEKQGPRTNQLATESAEGAAPTALPVEGTLLAPIIDPANDEPLPPWSEMDAWPEEHPLDLLDRRLRASDTDGKVGDKAPDNILSSRASELVTIVSGNIHSRFVPNYSDTLSRYTSQERYEALCSLLPIFSSEYDFKYILYVYKEAWLKEMSPELAANLAHQAFSLLRFPIGSHYALMALSPALSEEVLADILAEAIDMVFTSPHLLSYPSEYIDLFRYLDFKEWPILAPSRNRCSQIVREKMANYARIYQDANDVALGDVMRFLVGLYTNSADQAEIIKLVFEPLIEAGQWTKLFSLAVSLDPNTHALYLETLYETCRDHFPFGDEPDMGLLARVASRFSSDHFSAFLDQAQSHLNLDFYDQLFWYNNHLTPANSQKAADALYNLLGNRVYYLDRLWLQCAYYCSPAKQAEAIRIYQGIFGRLIADKPDVISNSETIANLALIRPELVTPETVALILRAYPGASLNNRDHGYTDLTESHDLLATCLETILAKRPDLAGSVAEHFLTTIAFYKTTHPFGSAFAPNLEEEKSRLPAARILGLALALNPDVCRSQLPAVLQLLNGSEKPMAYYFMVALKELIYRRPDIVDMSQMVTAAGTMPDEIRGMFLAEVIEPLFSRRPADFSLNDWNGIKAVFGSTGRFKYFTYFVVQNLEVPEDIKQAAKIELEEQREAGLFPLHEEVRQVLGHGSPRVLIVANALGGLGDEQLRTVRLMQALLACNPDLEITIQTIRPSSYHHPRIRSVSLKHEYAATRKDVVDGLYSAVFGFGYDGLTGHDSALENLPLFVHSTSDASYRPENYPAYQRSVFDVVRVNGQEVNITPSWAEPSVYDSEDRLLAELGLPMGDEASGVDLFNGMENPSAETAWQKINQGNSQNRPVLVLNPFGGSDPGKGYLDSHHARRFNREGLKKLISDLVERGYYVVVVPVNGGSRSGNYTKYGTRDEVAALLAELPEVVAGQTAVTDDLKQQPRGTLDYFVSKSSHVVTVEGGMAHNAVLQHKDVSVIMVPYGETSGTSAWLPNHPQSCVRIITGLDIENEVPAAAADNTGGKAGDAPDSTGTLKKELQVLMDPNATRLPPVDKLQGIGLELAGIDPAYVKEVLVPSIFGLLDKQRHYDGYDADYKNLCLCLALIGGKLGETDPDYVANAIVPRFLGFNSAGDPVPQIDDYFPRNECIRALGKPVVSVILALMKKDKENPGACYFHNLLEPGEMKYLGAVGAQVALTDPVYVRDVILPALRDSMSTHYDRIYGSYVEALCAIAESLVQTDPDFTLEALVPELKLIFNSPKFYRPRFIEALQKMGIYLAIERPKLAETKIVPLLADMLSEYHGHDQTAHLAVSALVAIGSPSIRPLVELLDNNDHYYDSNARDILVGIGKPAIPALVATLAMEGRKGEQAQCVLIGIGIETVSYLLDPSLKQNSLQYARSRFTLEKIAESHNYYLIRTSPELFWSDETSETERAFDKLARDEFLLLRIWAVCGSKAEDVCTMIPLVRETAEKVGLSPDQIVSLLGEIVDKTGVKADIVFRGLPALLELGFDPNLIIALFSENRGQAEEQNIFSRLTVFLQGLDEDQFRSGIVALASFEDFRISLFRGLLDNAHFDAARQKFVLKKLAGHIPSQDYFYYELLVELESPDQKETAKTIKNHGFQPTPYLVAHYQPGIEVEWKAQIDRITGGKERFDTGNELHVALMYTVFRGAADLCFSSPEKYTYQTYLGIIASAAVEGSSPVLSSDQQAELVYAGYEAFRVYQFLMDLKQVAQAQGRKILVVPNYSYGRFVEEPLRKYLEGDDTFRVVSARIGSTESHDNEFVLHSAKIDRIFDKNIEQMIMEEQPIIVMIDGSNSFSQGRITRYPDAQKGYVNFAIAINDVLGVDQSGVQRTAEHITGLRTTEDYRILTERLRSLGIASEGRQPYQVHYWNPAGTTLAVSEGHHGTRAAVGEVPTVDASTLSGPAIIIVNSVFNDGHQGIGLPEEVRAFGNNKHHEAAYFDDTHHIQNILFKVGSSGIEIQDHIYEKIQQEFRRFLYRKFYSAIAESGILTFDQALEMNLHRLYKKETTDVVRALTRQLEKRNIVLSKDQITQLISLIKENNPVSDSQDYPPSPSIPVIETTPASVEDEGVYP